MFPRPRARDIGLTIGTLPTGPQNAITDVPGVRVGHATLVEGAGELVPGVGPVRTGVTAILPHAGDVFRDKVAAWVERLSGFGEVTGSEQVRELGALETPIVLTGTTHVPRAAAALTDWLFARDPALGVSTWPPMPVVAECSDQYLSDVRGAHVRAEHVWAALEAAAAPEGAGPVAEGGVGAGTGMSCCEFKGGIGTASRALPEHAGGFTLGVLVLSNFGRREHLTVDGVPVGRALLDWAPAPAAPAAEAERVGSSIIMVLATDAPMDARQLRRLCVRAGGGLARAGGLHSTTSGDFAIAFSTGHRTPHVPAGPVLAHAALAESMPAGHGWPAHQPTINYAFQAALEATEEAILNSLFAAETRDGHSGRVRHALPIDETVAILKRHGRM